MFKKIILLITAIALMFGFSACNTSENSDSSQNTAANEPSSEATAQQEIAAQETQEQSESGSSEQSQSSGLPQLSLIFGYEGQSFIIELENNQTALEIARDVGATEWNLPIFTFDNFENSDVLQFYDIPSHYEYSSSPETVTSEKAGDVYYSDPNRIVLFYHDADITAEYTKIGTIDATEEFLTALEENPILEGWNCKIITINRVD